MALALRAPLASQFAPGELVNRSATSPVTAVVTGRRIVAAETAHFNMTGRAGLKGATEDRISARTLPGTIGLNDYRLTISWRGRHDKTYK